MFNSHKVILSWKITSLEGQFEVYFRVDRLLSRLQGMWSSSNAPSMIFKGRMTGTGIDWATREDRKIKSKEMPGVILR